MTACAIILCSGSFIPHLAVNQTMHERRFSNWTLWQNRSELDNIRLPGVYAIRISTRNIENRTFSFHKEIVYFGMTNGISGLKGRLKAFDNTIRGKRGHGGADRFRYKHRSYPALVKTLFVSIAPFKADVRSIALKDLVTMGKIKQHHFCKKILAPTFSRSRC